MNSARRVTRRQALALGGASVAGAWCMNASGILRPPAAAAVDDPFETLRAKWKGVLTGGDDVDPSVPEVRAAIDTIDTTANQFLQTLVLTPSRTFLWEDLNFSGSATEQSIDMRLSYERLQQIVLAYATTGSSMEADPDLLDVLLDALDWLYEHKYNEVAAPIGNWFNWQVSSPLALNACAIMLYDDLSSQQLTNYTNAIGRHVPLGHTGANRVWVAMNTALRAALVGDDRRLAAARDALSPVFRYVTAGDGFYTNGSFIQHARHPYTGGYGATLIANLSRLVYWLHGSPWEVMDPNAQNIFDWVTESYEPWLHRGSMMSGVRGRNISRYNQPDHLTGHEVVRSLLWLAGMAEPNRAGELRGLVKHTVMADQYRNFLDYLISQSTTPVGDLGAITASLKIVNDDSIEPRQPLVQNKAYPRMDRVVHRQQDFAFSLSMSSSRIFTYESINNENLRGWYTGDGMHYLYNADLAQYDDGFWATVDHRRLPGTTVPIRSRANGSGRNHLSPHPWVGGASLDELGAAGMEFQTYDDQLLSTFRLRLTSDGHAVTAAWSPDGTRWVNVGSPAPVGSFVAPHIGMYAARGLSDAASIEARFESFRVTCDGDCAGPSDEFDGEELDRSRWTRIVREDASRYRVEDGALVLMTDRGEFDRGADSTRNIVLQPMPGGAWEAIATVSFVPQASYQHAGIAVFDDDQNFVRIHRIFASGGDRFSFVEQHDGAREQSVNSFPQQEFDPPELVGTPHGFKSWFMFGDRIALIGSGITATSSDPVETIIENRKLASPSSRLIVDGNDQPTDPNWQRSFDDVSWVHLEGSEPGADVGYVFPDRASFTATRELRTGKWTDVNTSPTFFDDTPIDRPYLTMWFDHGAEPVDASYAWLLLPGASAADVRSYATNPDIEILTNSSRLQAVRSGGVLAANFWTDDGAKVSGLTCNGQASVIVDHSGHNLAIAIADPTHLGDEVELILRRRAKRVMSADPRIRVDTLSPFIAVTVNVAGAQGRTLIARFDVA